MSCPSLALSNNGAWSGEELKFLFVLPHGYRLDERRKRSPFHFLFLFLFLLSYHLLFFFLWYFLGIIINVSTILAHHFHSTPPLWILKYSPKSYENVNILQFEAQKTVLFPSVSLSSLVLLCYPCCSVSWGMDT